MRGLKTQESDKFNNYFLLIQKEAHKQHCVFFADAGDGNDFETSTMEGEIMMGWLVPEDRASDFERVWKSSLIDDVWSDYYVWAVWEIENDIVSVRFE